MCAVYGEGSVFPMEVALTEHVVRLQKYIAKKMQNDTVFKNMKLFVAKDKNGFWLKTDATLDTMLQEGNRMSEFYQMHYAARLSGYFAQNFTPSDGEIHVLVELSCAPAPLFKSRIGLADTQEDRQQALYYHDIAQALKAEDEVVQLVNVIHYAERHQDTPLVILEASSRMGKTQMAFNLMAWDNLEVFYVACDPINGFESYSLFTNRSAAFKQCLLLDLDYLSDGGIKEILDETQMYTFGFIWALLTEKSVFYGRQSIEQVQSAVGARQKTCVFFLDDFPSPCDPDGFRNFRYLRLMRNSFRAFGLVTIICCTHGHVRDLIDPGDELHERNEAVWCVVVPSLPCFQDDMVPRIVSGILLNSRPQFAKTALKHIQANPMNADTNLVEYMDAVAAAVTDVVGDWRSKWFRIGQICLFFPHSFADRKWGRFTDGHYATLKEHTPFELRHNPAGKLVKNDETEPWKSLTALPPVEKDVLLYLSFTGGRMFRALASSTSRPIPFHRALSDAEKDTRPLICFQKANQTLRLEAIVAGSIVIASHKNGLAGIAFGAFFSALMYELGLQDSPDALAEFPAPIRGEMVSFLAPPNAPWPSFLLQMLPLKDLNVQRHGDRIDINFSVKFSAECQCYRKPIDRGCVMSMLARVPESRSAHLIITNQPLKDCFKYPLRSLQELLNCRPWLQNTRLYRFGKSADPRLVEIQGFNNTEHQSSHVNKLVVFVELPANE